MITEIRHDILTRIHLIIEQPLSLLSLPRPDRKITFCRSKDTSEVREMCEYMQLGSLVTSLRTGGLTPFPTVDQYEGSVADLAQRVQAVKVSRFKMPGTVPHLDTHINCGVPLKEAVEHIMQGNAKMSREVFQQLKTRAKKSGAFNEKAFENLEIAGIRF